MICPIILHSKYTVQTSSGKDIQTGTLSTRRQYSTGRLSYIVPSASPSTSMDLHILRQRVLALFDDIDRKTTAFRRQTGISCPRGCGICCEYPCVQATVLEMIPLACHLWETSSAMTVYRTISVDETICHFYCRESGEDRDGACTVYEHRGLICRTFGFFSARRAEGIRFSTCRSLRARYADRIALFSEKELAERLPLYPDFVDALAAIAPELAANRCHINQAIKRAVEAVHLLHGPFSDQDLPRKTA